MVQLGQTVFDLSKQMLLDSKGAKIALRAQTILVLEHLIKANGALVTKDQLVNVVWGNIAVTDDSLVQCIGEIRAAIGDVRHQMLQTEHRRGYRLISPIETKTLTTTASPVAHTDRSASPVLHAIAPQSIDGQITPAIAVMAFTSLDGDERSERLAMTFAGDLITELARHKELRVIGRFSSFSLKGQPLSSKEVCDKLNARYIVSGQVQFTETTIQWSLEMMDGQNDEIAWSERKQVKFTDIYTETAALFWRIAGSIHANFKTFIRRKSMAKGPDSINAYDLCARVEGIIYRTTAEATRDGQLLATQAVALYPDYSRAWRVLAHAHMWDINFCHTGASAEQNIAQALKEVHKAIELDPAHAYAYATLANLLDMNGQRDEALLASDQAIELGPSDPVMLHFRAMVLFYAGQFAESRATSESLLPLMSTRSGAILGIYGRTLLALGECNVAISVLQETLALSPGNTQARMALIVALEEAGEYRRADEHFHDLLAHTNGFDESYFGMRWNAIPDIRDRFVKALRAHGIKRKA
jgi:TolB-like protein/cytochrome c-type biogenesis protein CcmH/NrfG